MVVTTNSAEPKDTGLMLEKLAEALFWALEMTDTRWEWGERLLEEYEQKYGKVDPRNLNRK